MKDNHNHHNNHEHNAKNQFNFMYDMFKKMMQIRMPDMTDTSKNIEMQKKNFEGMMQGQEIVAQFFQKLLMAKFLPIKLLRMKIF